MRVNGLGSYLDWVHDACGEAKTWLNKREHQTLRQTWAQCERPDWLLFVMGAAGVPKSHAAKVYAFTLLEVLEVVKRSRSEEAQAFWMEVTKRLETIARSGRFTLGWYRTVVMKHEERSNDFDAYCWSTGGENNVGEAIELQFDTWGGFPVDAQLGTNMHSAFGSSVPKVDRPKICDAIRQFYPWSQFRRYAERLVRQAQDYHGE